MINVLIIDDDSIKLEKIKNVFTSYRQIPLQNIHVCKCMVDAKKSLRENQYDLVILDIQLPVHFGDDPVLTGGLDLLREIHERTIYQKPHCIMGLSAYTETIDEANSMFQDKLWSIVLYKPSDSDWSNRLDRKIEYILESVSNNNQGHSEFDYNLAIITALPSPEFSNVQDLTDWESLSIQSDSTRYTTGRFTAGDKSLKVVAGCAPQMGMPAAAVLATKMISHFKPEYLCMVGITAGVMDSVALGDIIVADPSWDWGSGKLRESSEGTMLLPDPMPERLEPKTRAMLRDAALDKTMIQEIWNSWKGNKPDVPPVFHVGPSVSGASVVADGQIVEAIKSHSRNLIGLEMEAYGIMHAASNSVGNRPLAFSMKSVCDFADKSKSDDIQDFAAFMSANLLKKMALKYF